MCIVILTGLNALLNDAFYDTSYFHAQNLRLQCLWQRLYCPVSSPVLLLSHLPQGVGELLPVCWMQSTVLQGCFQDLNLPLSLCQPGHFQYSLGFSGWMSFTLRFCCLLRRLHALRPSLCYVSMFPGGSLGVHSPLSLSKGFHRHGALQQQTLSQPLYLQHFVCELPCSVRAPAQLSARVGAQSFAFPCLMLSQRCTPALQIPSFTRLLPSTEFATSSFQRSVL